MFICFSHGVQLFSDPPTYAESVGGAVRMWDEDEEDEENMGYLTYTPMYTYMYNYRPPQATQK